MKKIITNTIILIFIQTFLFAQNSSIDSLENILKNYKNNDSIKVNLLIECASKNKISDKEKSLEYALQADSLSDLIHFANGKKNSLLFLSEYYEFSYEAIVYRQQLIDIYKGENDKQKIAYGLYFIGLIYYNANISYTKALNYYKQSLVIAIENNDKKVINMCYSDIGNIYRIEKKDSAYYYLNKSLETAKERNDSTETNYCYTSIGQLYIDDGDYTKANEYLQKSLKYFLNQELTSEIEYYLIIIYNQLCHLNFLQKKYSVSLKYAEISLNLIENGKYYMIFKNEILKLLSEVHSKINNFEKAYKYRILYETLNDSLLNEEGIKKLSEYEVTFKYKKEREIRDLKQQQQEELYKSKLKEERLLRYVFYSGIIALIIILFFIYRSYRIKKKVNMKLINKNNFIKNQNEELQQQKEEIQTQNEVLNQKNVEINSQKDEIEIQRDHANKQKEELISSITYAKRIQEAVLPSQEYVNKILQEHFILFKPQNIVSGDFYWIKKIKNLIIIATADCTGHGVPGAFMSMLGSSFLNEIITVENLDSPGEILNRLRLKVKKSLKQEGKVGEQKDGMDIAFYVIDTETFELQFSGAYNPLYIIRKKNDKPELLSLKADRQPIAIHIVEKSFTTHKFQLKKEDCLYTFSDGFVDQFGGENDSKFKTKNFKKLLLSIFDKPMQKQKQKLNEEFENWRGNVEQIDDVLIIGVKI